MDAYLDASVLVALLIHDALTARARAFLQTESLVLFVSDYAETEVASVIARRVRTRELTATEAKTAFDSLDHWTRTFTQRIETAPTDIAAAGAFIRRLDLTLRAPDAIHIAIAQRFGIEIATFDLGMASSATTLGVKVAPA